MKFKLTYSFQIIDFNRKTLNEKLVLHKNTKMKHVTQC